MQTSVWQPVIEALVPLVALVVTSVVSLIGLELRKRISSGYAQDLTRRAESLAQGIVRELEQTTVAAFREKAADGKIDQNDAAAVKDQALAKLKAQLGDKGVKELESVLGLTRAQLEAFLASKLEQGVYQLKVEQSER
jgi:hypothetical protein